ncbi:hypothetical protein Dimus_034559 [Dionaea muscipula]
MRSRRQAGNIFQIIPDEALSPSNQHQRDKRPKESSCYHLSESNRQTSFHRPTTPHRTRRKELPLATHIGGLNNRRLLFILFSVLLQVVFVKRRDGWHLP